MLRLLKAKPEHLPPIAAKMRRADRLELRASRRRPRLVLLEESLAASSEAWVVTENGVPFLVWGLVKTGGILGIRGVPWLIATDRLVPYSLKFLRRCRPWVEHLKRDVFYLENYVHSENELSIFWLKWCGFKIETEVPILINNEIFYRFFQAGALAKEESLNV